MDKEITKKYKIALCFICLNVPYWPFAKDVIEDCRKHFLTNHEVDYFLWSDMPEDTNYSAKVFPTESVEWPLPTLMRYHLFLQQEEILKDYDYIFYMDVDMRVVAPVGEEILGEGLTAANHPMYCLRQGLYPPLEPNPNSSAYIKLPGRYIQDGDKKRFRFEYFAGGLQGGRAKDFIQAMKVMKKNIDKDFTNNYVAIWNDETHWNRYLFDNPPSVILDPGYIYPDSLIEDYYKKIWGRDYTPKIITLTKKFTVTQEAGNIIREQLSTL